MGILRKKKRGSRYDQTTICLKRKYIETRAYHGRRRGSFRTYADRLKICHPRKNQERLVIYIHEGVMWVPSMKFRIRSKLSLSFLDSNPSAHKKKHSIKKSRIIRKKNYISSPINNTNLKSQIMMTRSFFTLWSLAFLSYCTTATVALENDSSPFSMLRLHRRTPKQSSMAGNEFWTMPQMMRPQTELETKR